MTNKHTFTTAEGNVETRNSKSRVYTHVVVGRVDGTEYVLRWSGSFENASKAVGEFTSRGVWTGLRVAEVDAR